MDRYIQAQYRHWLENPALRPEDRAELEALQGNEAEIEDRFYRDMEFGTAGMRGVMEVGRNRMNRYTVMRATAGLAQFLLEKNDGSEARGVAVSFDSRRNSELFAEWTAGVLTAYGIRVYLYESLRPVPMLSFALRECSCAAGVMITASHNPKQYNGYKVYGPSGGQMEPEDAAKVSAKIDAIADFGTIPLLSGQEAVGKGLLTLLGRQMDERYFRRVGTVSLSPGVYQKVDSDFRVVYTPVHGSGSMPVQEMLRRAGVPGVTVVKAQEHPDPDFSTVRVPNPEESDTLGLAIALAREVGADLCIGTDPDCDRMGLAVRDKDGGFCLLTGNQIGCLLLHYILTARKAEGKLPENGAVVRSVVSSLLSDAIAEDFCVHMDCVLTGFKFIAGKIGEYEETGSHTFLFGFEESFGYLAGAFVRDKDAVQASLLTCEMAAWYRLQGKTLLDALEELYRRYGYYREDVKNFGFQGKEGMAQMAGLMENLRTNPPKDLAGRRVTSVVDYEKGIRTFSDGAQKRLDLPPTNMIEVWVEGGDRFIMRPSGTEPKVKLYFGVRGDSEAQAEAKSAALMEAAVQACGL